MHKFGYVLGTGLLMLISLVALRYFHLMPKGNTIAHYLTIAAVGGFSAWISQIATNTMVRQRAR